jgi:hypothetical protein
MRMDYLKHLLLAGALTILLLPASRAQADGWFFLDPIALEAEIRFEGYGYNTKSDASNTPSPSNNRKVLLLEERILIDLGGYVIDPRIGKIDIALVPVFRQGRENLNDETDGISGNDLDYNVRLGIMQGSASPVDAYLSTYRATSANDIAFGSRNYSDISEHNLSLNWKNHWFPTSFSYRATSFLQEYTRLDGLKSRRDEDRQVFSLQGRSRKLAITLESENVDEKVFDRDYSVNRALVNHTFRWGRNSSIFSDIRFFDRKEFNAYRQFSWNERVLVNHSESLFSTTEYRYFSQRALTDSTSHEGLFELDHSLYDNLNSYFRLRGQSQTADTYKRQELEVRGGANYRKTFDFGAISARLFGNYRLTDRVSETGAAEVIDENHVASLIDPIILEEQLVAQASIVVTAEDGFVYGENIDYEVRLFGGVYTRIRIIPTGRITAGDVLLVSYLYELLPSAKFNELSIGYNFSYNYRWIRLYHNAYRFDYRLISGYGLPEDQKNRQTGLELTWNFPNVLTRFSAETRFRQHGGFENKTVALNQTLSVFLSNILSLNLTGNQLFSKSNGVVRLDPLIDPESQINEISTDLYGFDASLTWFAGPNLTVIPTLGAWKQKERDSTEITRNFDRLHYKAELRVTWLVRKLTMDFFYNHNASDINGTKRLGNRLYFSVRRRFR